MDGQTNGRRMDCLFVCWLVGFLRLNDPLETVFQFISGRLPERGRKKREVIDDRKKCPNNPHPHLLQAQ